MLPAVSDYFGGPHNLIRGSALFVIVLLFYWYDIRPYGLLSIIFLLYVLSERVRNESIVFNCPAISEKSLQEIKKFREDHPGKFCAFSSASFILLAILGNIISGPLFFILIAVCFIGKKYLPENVKEACNQSTWSSNIKEFEDFIPELNEKNLELLNYAQDPKSKNDSDAESDKTEAFLLDKTPNISDTSSESGDDTKLIPTEGIEFLSGHFNGDSMMEDDYFEKGLNLRKMLHLKMTQ
ncbi:uncharacterized protein LOC113384039 [Ctenocephalides felis]|uniref:uncharacterized protein LOC113384039 n=1 Tax=Ctenocephalides felis TaxID=7515 RepID=UPI000E6E1506|nr:uncharacterized protein LOC113384039 [Ctenocephalides felis]